MNSTNDGARAQEDYEDMQKAFQEFMLGGGKATMATTTATATAPASSSPSPLLPTSSSAPSPPHSMNHRHRHNDSAASSRSSEQQWKKQQRRRRSIFVQRQHRSARQAFHTVLVDDWLHADDQLGRVVDAIANLRHRIWLTSSGCRRRRLFVLKQDDAEPLLTTSTSKSIKLSCWKNYGYRGSMSSSLSSSLKFQQNHHQQSPHQKDDDLELALSHSILMHENMMTTCRKQLLPLLHEAQETLGRRLEDFMAIVIADETTAVVATLAADGASIEEDDDDDDDEEDSDDDEEWMTRMQIELQECQELYRATAEELYRKQEMVQVCILDTVHDGLLYNNNNSNSNESSSSSSENSRNNKKNDPQASANRCSSQWSRRTKASALYKYQDMLDRIVQEQQKRRDE